MGNGAWFGVVSRDWSLYRENDRKERERACEAKRDLNWRRSDMWVSPHHPTPHPPREKRAGKCTVRPERVVCVGRVMLTGFAGSLRGWTDGRLPVSC